MNENNNHNKTQFMINVGLPNILIKNLKRNVDGHYEITVQSTLIGTPCHKCGKHITNPHGHGREICLRDLPVFGVPVLIKIVPKRYKCFCCDSTTTQQPSWYYQRSPNTFLFRTHFVSTYKCHYTRCSKERESDL